MNKVKSIAGGLTVIAAIIATTIFFSFKPSEQARAKEAGSRVAQSWYYKLTSMDPADLNNPSNYQSTPLPGATCGSGDIVCRIEDEANSGNSTIPALSHGNVSSNLTAYRADFKEAE